MVEELVTKKGTVVSIGFIRTVQFGELHWFECSDKQIRKNVLESNHWHKADGWDGVDAYTVKGDSSVHLFKSDNVDNSTWKELRAGYWYVPCHEVVCNAFN